MLGGMKGEKREYSGNLRQIRVSKHEYTAENTWLSVLLPSRLQVCLFWVLLLCEGVCQLALAVGRYPINPKRSPEPETVRCSFGERPPSLLWQRRVVQSAADEIVHTGLLLPVDQVVQRKPPAECAVPLVVAHHAAARKPLALPLQPPHRHQKFYESGLSSGFLHLESLLGLRVLCQKAQPLLLLQYHISSAGTVTEVMRLCSPAGVAGAGMRGIALHLRANSAAPLLSCGWGGTTAVVIRRNSHRLEERVAGFESPRRR